MKWYGQNTLTVSRVREHISHANKKTLWTMLPPSDKNRKGKEASWH